MVPEARCPFGASKYVGYGVPLRVGQGISPRSGAHPFSVGMVIAVLLPDDQIECFETHGWHAERIDGRPNLGNKYK